jgi:DNA-binding FadR family transcriptional regulator
VLDLLGPAIVGGDRQPGSVLRTEQLAIDYGVSRTVIREAVRVLESMNVVSTRRRVGLTVLPREGWNVFDPLMIRWRLEGADRVTQLRSLGELRGGIEPVAAGLAALRATPEQCGGLTGAVIGMSVAGKQGDREVYLQHDIDFHRTLLQASGNEMFASLADVVAEVLTGRSHHHLMPSRPEPEAIRLHIEVADAVQSGDGRHAEEAMRAILARSAEALKRAAATTDNEPNSGPRGHLENVTA